MSQHKAAGGAERINIAHELVEETNRQVAKWGVQDWPMYTRLDIFDHNQEFGTELNGDNAKACCEFKSDDRRLSWFDITTEEFLEARDEAVLGNKEKLREELIQAGACIISMIASLDRNGLDGIDG